MTRRALKDALLARAEVADENAQQARDREDTRKLVWAMQKEQRPRTAEYYALTVGLPLERVVDLLERMEQDGDVKSAGGGDEHEAG